MRLFLIRYKTIILACVLLSLSLYNMSSEIKPDQIKIRSYLFEIVLNIEKVFLNIKTSFKDVFINTKNINQLEKELEEVQEQVLYYKEMSRLYNQYKQENIRLRSALDIRNIIQYSAYYSKVISRDPSLLADYLVIDKGYDSGLRINMPVVSTTDGVDLILVGKTVEVGKKFSRIQIVTAKNFYVGARMQFSGYIGILNGRGSWNQDLALEYIPVEASPTLEERIVTTGDSDIYPEGLYLGTIKRIKRNVMEEFFQTLYIKPAFDYSKISEVFVLDYRNEYFEFELQEGFQDGL